MRTSDEEGWGEREKKKLRGVEEGFSSTGSRACQSRAASGKPANE